MKRLFPLLLLLVVAAACSRSGTPTASQAPTPSPIVLSDAQVKGAVLQLTAVGPDRWEADPATGASTVLVGGKVGPGNVVSVKQAKSATTAFKQKDGTGYLSDTLVALPNEATAIQVMVKHTESDKTEWTQDFKKGGGATFTRTGGVPGLASLGDERFGEAMTVKITSASGSVTTRKVEYVAFRIRNLIGFVVTQDAGASVYASRLESKVARLS